MLTKYLALTLLLYIRSYVEPPATLPALFIDHQQPRIINLLLTDTIIKSRGTALHTIAINGQRPPRILMLTANEKVQLTLRNGTQDVLYLELPGKLVGQKARKIRQTLQKGTDLTLPITTANAGVYTYRIYQLEQVDHGTIGSLVIQ